MSALAFLSILGRSRAPGRWTLWWFPPVGAGLGAIVAGVHWGAHWLWPGMVAGVVVVAVDLALTGALHLDGLADSADGLLPHMERAKRLAVMATPGIGAFALAAAVPVMLARWAVLADPQVTPLSIVAVWMMSRTLVAAIPAFVTYARPDGLARPFLAGAYRWIAVWLIPATALLVVADTIRGAVAAAAATLAAAAVVLLARRRLGGFTGDVLGAVVMVSETVALLSFAARP